MGGGQQNRNQSLHPAADTPLLFTRSSSNSNSARPSSNSSASTRPRRKFQKRLPSRHLPQHQHQQQLPSYLTVAMGNFLTSPMTEKDTRVDARADGSLAFGISAMQGWRTSMEDSHVAQLAPEGFPPGTAIFAVCDGHGGRLAAAVSEDLFTTVILDVFDERKYYKPTVPTPEQIGDAMREAFMTLDAEIRSYPEVQNGSDQSGCTAIVAFVTPTHIIVANAGDSRSVLAKNAGMIPMSFDHKPMNDGERKRIENAGGMVRGNRVNGDLAVSRALGDFTYKMRSDLPAEQQQVSAEPEIQIQEINGSEEFLVLACDGIWDVMTNERICEFVRGLMTNGEKNLGLIAEEILDHCLQEGSRDNMSAIVVKFPGAKFGSGEGVEGIRKERKRKQEEAEARGETLENDNFGA